MEIIPAVDIKDGKCVRLYQGDFNQLTVYEADPLATARRWLEQGAQRLHLVDLDGARSGYPVNTATILSIVQAVHVPVQIGGGLRTEAAARAALDLGAARVILGTAAVQDPGLIERLVARHGDAVAVAVDARNGMITTDGWTEAVPVRAADFVASMGQLGVKRIIYTDIARDGTLSEPNFDAIFTLVQPGGPAIIASGGVCRIEHVQRLAAGGVEAAVIGRALYTGDCRLPEVIRAA